MKPILFGLATSFATMALSSAASAATLDDVKARGRLLCGVSQGLVGFSVAGADATWTGFDVDFCRAIAAAIFGDASKVEYFPSPQASGSMR